MFDTSSYNLAMRLMASLCAHERMRSGKSTKIAENDLAGRFGIPASPKRMRWEHKLFLTGSIKNNTRTGQFRRKGTHVQK